MSEQVDTETIILKSTACHLHCVDVSVLLEAFRHDDGTSVDKSSDVDTAGVAPVLLLFKSLSRSTKITSAQTKTRLKGTSS